MIRYPISQADLEQRIEDFKPGWKARADARTTTFRSEHKYSEKSSIWSEVKPVYMTLQGESKCAYCERKMESVASGKGEQDVEHFRPKGNISPWVPPDSIDTNAIRITQVPADATGYYLLPYHLFNYAASCKPCNSKYKGDRFPIAGRYDQAGDDPDALSAEQPYLIYPIGDIDADPEDLISFNGVSPYASGSGARAIHRGLVTIAFFGLDDFDQRKNLLLERARVITLLYDKLVASDSGDAETAQRAGQFIAALTNPKAPHTNCARSFLRLYRADRNEAKAFNAAAEQLLISSS